MAVVLEIGNFFEFLSYISPFLVGFLMIMISFMNRNIKGLVYLGGVLLVAIVNVFLQNIAAAKGFVIPNPQGKVNGICNVFLFSGSSINANLASIPPFNSVFLAFTLAYTYLPLRGVDDANYLFFGFLLSLFMLDGFVKVNRSCTTPIGVLLGGIIGYIFGSLFYGIVENAGLEKLLYFSEMSSSKEVCSRPTKQRFKCEVYQNGKLIKSS